MSKCSKTSNGSSSERESKNEKPKSSALFEREILRDFQIRSKENEKGELIKDLKEKMLQKESFMKPRASDSIYNIEDMNSEELHKSLNRIKKNPTQPFKFLSHILDDVDVKEHYSLDRGKPTDIDLQLISLVKRVEMNKSLLERTNQRVKDINFIVEKNKILSSRELNYNKDSLPQTGDYVKQNTELSVAHPGIDELQQTMKDTLEMLDCIKKITSRDEARESLPSRFFNNLESRSVLNHSENQVISTQDAKLVSE